MLLLLSFALLQLAYVSADGAGHDWGYARAYGHLKPEQWHLHYPQCGGQRQSPIDIDEDAITPDHTLKPLHIVNYRQRLNGLVVLNDGHTLKITSPKLNNLRISSPSLPAAYKLTQFHFHWPSEHTVTGSHFPLELHLVHANTRLSDNDTVTKPTGLVVVAVMFDYKVDQQTTNTMQWLEAEMIATSREGENATLPIAVTLNDLLPADKSYIRYSGSLTTPPCAEVVEFHVLTHTMPITKSDIIRFHSLRHEAQLSETAAAEVPIRHNDRPLQPLHGRPLRLHGTVGDFEFDL